LAEACAIDPSRGVDAAARAYPLFWAADRAPELFEFMTDTLLPLLNEVAGDARVRFLVSRVEHLVSYGAPDEMRGPATQMMTALEDISDPALEARAHIVNAWRYEACGEFDRVDI